jgi:methanogenic corrinoid protein MtbC1
MIEPSVIPDPKADADKQVVGVIGVVEGDVHDIGKNIVKTMLTAAGLDMHDFGKDVPIENFVNSVKENKAQLIAMSTLMTPTMDGMKAVADGLVENGDRPKVKIIIGGAPTSPAFQEEIAVRRGIHRGTEVLRFRPGHRSDGPVGRCGRFRCEGPYGRPEHSVRH